MSEVLASADFDLLLSRALLELSCPPGLQIEFSVTRTATSFGLWLSWTPEHKQSRKDRKRNTYFHKFGFCSSRVTADMFFNKPVTKEFPYCLSRENHFRNVSFEICHNILSKWGATLKKISGSGLGNWVDLKLTSHQAIVSWSYQWNINIMLRHGPPLWSSGQNSWLLTQRSRDRKLSLTTVGDPPRWPRDTPLSTKVGTKFRR
jgi:hypothetical protein